MDTPPSFEFAKEMVTQLITLSTGVIGVSITFAKDIQPSVKAADRKWLIRSWLLFLASIVLGVWVLGAMTGKLAVGPVTDDAVYASSITWPAIGQSICFLLGVSFLVCHAKRQ